MPLSPGSLVAHPEPHPCERVAPAFARREVLIDTAAASKIPHEEADETTDKDPDRGAREP